MNYRLLCLPLYFLANTPLLGFKGYTHLLDKRYDEVTFAATHNGQSNLPPTRETLIPVQNQTATITEQLESGIRAMKIPVFWQEGLVIATHGVNDGVKKQVKTLVDTKLDELITQRINDAKEDLGDKIKAAQTIFDNLNNQLKSFPKKIKETIGYGRFKKTIEKTLYAPDWLKDQTKNAKTTLDSLLKDKENLGESVKNELTKNAEDVLGAFISKKVLNIYFNPDKVKPSDLDPAGRPLLNILREVKTFMDKNPTEIVTIFLEVFGFKDPQRILDVFRAAKLENNLYVQDPSQPWPTLKELSKMQKGLVVFIDFSVDTKTYPFNFFKTFVWDSSYLFTEVSQLKNDSGAAKKPTPEWLSKPNKLFVLQHFITETTGGTLLKSPDANKKSVIVDRAQRYMKTFNMPKPNFIWVDFFATAPLADNLKEIINKVPMKLSLEELKSGNWPKLDISQLKKQSDVFDAVDALNDLA